VIRTIPLEDFFRNPEKTSIQISPEGDYLAWLEPYESMLNIFVKDLQTGEVKRVTNATKRGIYGFFWANKNRIVYVMDEGGDENMHLYGVDWDGANPIDFTPFDKVKCNLLDDLENDEEHILFSMNQRNATIFDVYRLNLDTGEMQMIAENPGNILGWLTDHDGKLRFALASDGVNQDYLYRETEDAEFREIANYNFKENAGALFFTMDNRALYVSSNLNRDKRALYEYDLATGRPVKLVFEHPDVDVSNLLFSKARKVITGAVFYTDKRRYHFFDEHRRQIQDFLDNQLPGFENSLSSYTRDESKYIAFSATDRSRGAYYLLDVDKWTLEKLFDVAPWLNPDELAEVKPIQYTARDGLKINGYLTLPVGKEAKNLPVVVNPHGGPWARDLWGFNPELQFLANRGYAVLQMNFRGSTGYGRKFWELSFKEWGLTMQDDITDAVDWLVAQGIADPKRIAIYGASYGGYATLMGIVKNPDLYAAAVDYVGVSNMFTFLESIPPYWEPIRNMLYEMVGHPETDAEYFKSVSPSLNAEKIKTPLFIAQGANDPRVKKQESDQMVEALQARGVEVEYMVKDDEGHGFFNEANQFDFYRAMEAFLQKHIG